MKNDNKAHGWQFTAEVNHPNFGQFSRTEALTHQSVLWDLKLAVHALHVYDNTNSWANSNAAIKEVKCATVLLSLHYHHVYDIARDIDIGNRPITCDINTGATVTVSNGITRHMISALCHGVYDITRDTYIGVTLSMSMMIHIPSISTLYIAAVSMISYVSSFTTSL